MVVIIVFDMQDELVILWVRALRQTLNLIEVDRSFQLFVLEITHPVLCHDEVSLLR